MTRLFTCVLTFVVLLAAAGCGHIKTPAVAFTDDGDYLPPDVGNGLVASPTPLIPDVPMPIGFKAVPSKCSSGFDGRVRTVRHVYQGHAKQGDAVDFYRLALVENKWDMVDMQSVSTATVLRYTKGPERLNITADHRWGVTTLTIVIDGQ